MNQDQPVYQNTTDSRYLEISLGKEKYVLPLLFVREVLADREQRLC